MLVAIVAALLGIAAPGAAASLREGFVAALALSAPLRALEVERDALRARRARADAWAPAAGSITLGYRTDQAFRDRGLREFEAEAGTPLWLPGEARALRDAADAALTALAARIGRERLAVANEVRAAWWEWREMRALLLAAEDRVASAQSLDRDLARQVGGGALPRSDRLAATAALREAEAARREARRDAHAAAAAFQVLAGSMPGEGPDETAAGRPDGDPRLLAAATAAASGQAAERLVRARDRANPELALQLRHEREAFNEPYGTRLAVLFTLPFGHAPLQRERAAIAQATTATALAAIAPTGRAIEGGIDRARAALDAATAMRAAADQRHAALAEQTALLTAAWRAGELPLAEVLRTRAALADAAAAQAVARIGAGRAVSLLNQALGVEPR